MAILTLSVLVAACLAGMVAMLEARRRRQQQRKAWQRHEQLLIHGLRLRGMDRPAAKQHLSERRAEMDRLLERLKKSADVLAEALATESHASQLSPDSAVPIDRWKEARARVAQAQEVHNRAVIEYREFVQELPVPLRAKAAEQGIVAMKVSHA
jgi:hypothetical protein